MSRVWPVPSTDRISAGFYQLRPLSKPPERRTHIHGAIDIPGPVGTDIVAPESGKLYAFMALRGGNVNRSTAEAFSRLRHAPPFDIAGHYYWYDIYGGVLVLVAEEHTHVIAHSYSKQLMITGPTGSRLWESVESRQDERWPVLAFHTFEDAFDVSAGDFIGMIGNAGTSTGPHIHWEIHNGRRWNKHENRVNPEDWV